MTYCVGALYIRVWYSTRYVRILRATEMTTKRVDDNLYRYKTPLQQNRSGGGKDKKTPQHYPEGIVRANQEIL